jgi:hypothetical protein
MAVFRPLQTCWNLLTCGLPAGTCGNLLADWNLCSDAGKSRNKMRNGLPSHS